MEMWIRIHCTSNARYSGIETCRFASFHFPFLVRYHPHSSLLRFSLHISIPFLACVRWQCVKENTKLIQNDDGLQG